MLHNLDFFSTTFKLKNFKLKYNGENDPNQSTLYAYIEMSQQGCGRVNIVQNYMHMYVNGKKDIC
jgi:hypothetical protein